MSALFPLFMATGGSSVTYELAACRAVAIPEQKREVIQTVEKAIIDGTDKIGTVKDRVFSVGAQMRTVVIPSQERTVVIEYESRIVYQR